MTVEITNKAQALELIAKLRTAGHHPAADVLQMVIDLSEITLKCESIVATGNAQRDAGNPHPPYSLYIDMAAMVGSLTFLATLVVGKVSQDPSISPLCELVRQGAIDMVQRVKQVLQEIKGERPTPSIIVPGTSSVN